MSMMSWSCPPHSINIYHVRLPYFKKSPNQEWLWNSRSVKFSKKKIKFLGHIVTPFGMSMDPSKLQAIREFPQPRNKKELQLFVVFCIFYRKFSCQHASIISSLIELLKKGRVWRFRYEELKLFQVVHESFTEQYHIPVLTNVSIFRPMRGRFGSGPNCSNYLQTETILPYLLLVARSTPPNGTIR